MLRAIYMAYCLVRECNHRLTGVRRDASLPTTVFVLAVLARAFGSLLAPLVSTVKRLSPGRPSLATTGMALATGRYVTSRIGGEQLRSTPYANAIIASGLAAPALQVLSLPLRLLRAARAGLGRAWRYLMRTAAKSIPGARTVPPGMADARESPGRSVDAVAAGSR